MSSSTIVARPYAKAIFEYALEAKAVQDWFKYLQTLAQAVLLPEAQQFIANPSVTPEMIAALLLSPFSAKEQKEEALSRWIHLLVEKKRVAVLPALFEQYQQMVAEYEKTLEVEVRAFEKLTAKQEKEMAERLTQKLKRKVTLLSTVDPALLGGVVVKAGDFVIDGSVQGKLQAMYEQMLA